MPGALASPEVKVDVSASESYILQGAGEGTVKEMIDALMAAEW